MLILSMLKITVCVVYMGTLTMTNEGEMHLIYFEDLGSLKQSLFLTPSATKSTWTSGWWVFCQLQLLVHFTQKPHTWIYLFSANSWSDCHGHWSVSLHEHSLIQPTHTDPTFTHRHTFSNQHNSFACLWSVPGDTERICKPSINALSLELNTELFLLWGICTKILVDCFG